MGIAMDVLLVVIAALIIFFNAKSGVFSGLFQFLKTVLSFLAAYFFGGMLGSFLNERFVKEPVYNFINGKLNGFYQEFGEHFTVEGVIESLPQTPVTDKIVENLSKLEAEGAALMESMTEAIASPISVFVSNVFAYAAIFLVAFVLLSIVVFFALKGIEKIKVVHTVDVILGAIFGVLISASSMLVISSVCKTALGHTSFYTDTYLIEFLGESGLLNYLSFLNIESLIPF